MTDGNGESSHSTLKDEGNVANENDQSSSDILHSKFACFKEFRETPAPTVGAKIKKYFYDKGLAQRPQYLEDIYNKNPRFVFVNYELPEDLKNHYGGPLITLPRNKIRTTKYTPVSFLPKNILFQFTNVANSYFLLVVILGAFQIFGVASPGMAAVPLIVIVCLTAIKDAFEDYKRGASDSDLNNSPIHLLSGLDNPNVEVDDIGKWRRFKKKCTRMNKSFARGVKKGWIFCFGSKKMKANLHREQVVEEENALRRVSTVISDYSYLTNRNSTTSRRKSHQSNRPHTKPLPNTLLNPRLQQENPPHTKFKNRRWKDVNVGDFIRIRANEEVPADVVIISCSDPEGNCYIETKNLDGETNLKTKSSLQCGGQGNLGHLSDLGSTKFWIECDPPNRLLYSFKGTIHYENYNQQGTLVNPDEKEPITNSNVLLRGCSLRNTLWVIGVVLYTGAESKIMLNSGITPTKSSRIAKELNFSVILNFVLLFILCFVSGLINGLFYNKKDVSRIYYDFQPYASTAAANGVLLFFVTLIIYQSLVPISLYISIEIIKTLQAFFIYSDIKMYYEKLDFCCIPKAWSISDDLGQIEYIFSDKTGTLTQNVMEFKKCTILGKSYGLAYTEAKQGLDKREGLDPIKESQKWKLRMDEDKEDMVENLTKLSENDQFREENLTFISNDYVEDVLSKGEQGRADEEFMLALALCHTVATEEDPQDPGLRIFQAESPDEAALVSVARDVGFVFKERMRGSLILEIYGKTCEYKLLEIVPFSSARKRMSCIVQTPENKVMLITKGADNVIFQRLKHDANMEEIILKTALHLEDFAKEGLRTLCIAQKELDPSAFDEWTKRYKEASASIEDDREDRLEELAEEIENGLSLLGGTAIEDRLQQGVPESISILGDAGIKLWVLTGDRIETAINIGFSCNLLETEMKLLVVRPDESNTPEYIDGLLTQYLDENFNISGDFDKKIEEAKKDHSTPSSKYAVIVDGAALSLIFDLEDSALEKKFLLLGKQCKSVICCRVSPAQKAQVVRMVKDKLGVMALAIGDGANDVAMIQAANVGVGIAGEEGRQAVMSSDYAIGQFRFLVRLILVHGRWSYKRLAEMIPCFFYKNVVFTFTCFWYGIFNNFDGSYLYEYTYLIFYNLAFTSLPIIVLAVLDQDVSDSVSLLVPQLYRTGILRLEWSQYKFLWYMADGIFQSVISFFFPYLLFYEAFQNPQGMTIDHRFWIGVVAVIIAVIASDIYVLLRQYRWDWLSLVIDIISILLVFFWTGVWSARTFAGEFYKAGAQVLGTLACWCCIFIGSVACLLPRYTYDFLMCNFYPRDVDIIRERVRQGVYDDYPQGYDPTNVDDVEKHRLITRMIDNSPELMENIEEQIENKDPDEHHTTLSRAIQTIKRRATITRPRGDSHLKTRKDLINEQFRKPMNLEELRVNMIKDGELNSRSSLDRVNTTHELPGLTQAETLISYHTRNSINFNS
ncbi:uncharacterized protein PRCAT00003833001 [Priceomyces carsonii]|uniref:uncharacterized protein n=1 Tax=Priceomyces carsonii TaxID=28549 RepID=UPI002ED91522|nr:unnamed protein product [Priceomyces carsonii]